MKVGRVVVLFAIFGAVLGMAGDGYFSYIQGWGYDLTRNVLSAIFVALVFGFSAHMGLKPKKVSARVEQVVGAKRTADDCYESIVIDQKEF